MYATSGKIGGFSISTDSLTSGNKISLEDDTESGVYLGPDGISIGSGFKVKAGEAGSTKVMMSTEVLSDLSAVSYWLSSTCTFHKGLKHGEDIVITAMKKIGRGTEEVDTEAFLWWKYKTESTQWTLATEKASSGRSIINFVFADGEVKEDDILVIATHDSQFDPNMEGIDVSTDSHIYERKEILFSPLKSIESTTKYYILMADTPSDIDSSYTEENPPTTDWKTSPVAFDRGSDTGKNYWETIRTKYNDNTYNWSTPVLCSMLTAEFISALGITAEKIDVGNTFSADAGVGVVTIGGFKITDTGIQDINDEPNLKLSSDGTITAKTGEIAGLQLATKPTNMFIDSEIKTTTLQTESVKPNNYIPKIDLINGDGLQPTEGLAGLKAIEALSEDQQIIITSVRFLNSSFKNPRTFLYFEPYENDPTRSLYSLVFADLTYMLSQSSSRRGEIEVSYFIRNTKKIVTKIQELASLDQNFICRSSEEYGSQVILDKFNYTTSKGNSIYSTEGTFGPIQLKNGQIKCNETAITFLTERTKASSPWYNGNISYVATISITTEELLNSVITIEITNPENDDALVNVWYDFIFPIRYKTENAGDTFFYDKVIVKAGNNFGLLNVDHNAKVTYAELLNWYTGEATSTFTFETRRPYEGDMNVKVWPETDDFSNSIIIQNANLIPQGDVSQSIYLSSTEGSRSYYPYSLGSAASPWGHVYTVYLSALGSVNADYVYAEKVRPPSAKVTNNVAESCTLGTSTAAWEAIYADQVYFNSYGGTISDKKVKNTINYDISKYDSVFDTLKPVSYKYNNGSSGRTHLGFIAQDIQESIIQADLTSKECSLVIIEGDGFDKEQGKVVDEEKATYYIRPEQLHALEVRQIQLLKQEVKELKAEIQELKSKITE
jgi:hypothetical protein